MNLYRGLSNLSPPDFSHILKYLTKQDKKSVRLVCNYFLHLVTNSKKGLSILKVDIWEKSEIFLTDYYWLINSTLDINIKLPIEYQIEGDENLRTRVIEFINDCQNRIVSIEVIYGTPVHLVEQIVPKLTQLQHMKVVSDLKIQSQVFVNLIQNSRECLVSLHLSDVTFHNFIFEKETALPNLQKLFLHCCAGNIGFQSLISSSTNLTELTLKDMNLNTLVVTDLPKLKEMNLCNCKGNSGIQALLLSSSNLTNLILEDIHLDTRFDKPLTNLNYLSLEDCDGEISSMVTQAAQSLTKMKLNNTDLDTKITKLLPCLTDLSLKGCSGEISSLLTQSASNLTNITLFKVDLETDVGKPFINLKVVKIGTKELNINNSLLLTKAGKLRLLMESRSALKRKI